MTYRIAVLDDEIRELQKTEEMLLTVLIIIWLLHGKNKQDKENGETGE